MDLQTTPAPLGVDIVRMSGDVLSWQELGLTSPSGKAGPRRIVRPVHADDLPRTQAPMAERAEKILQVTRLQWSKR